MYASHEHKVKDVSEVLRGFRYSAPQKKKIKRDTERGRLMQDFMEHLNPPRIKDGYAPLTYSRIGRIFEKIPTKDLYVLMSKCKQAKHFSKTFWWELKPKDVVPSIHT